MPRVTFSPAGDARPAQHPILDRLLAAAEGRFPSADGAVQMVPTWRPDLAAVVSFTGHAMIATAAPADLAGWALDGFGGALHPAVLLRLAGPGGTVGVLDATLVGRGTGAGSALEESDAWTDHPRVRHARALRDDVRVFGDARGLVTLAVGLAGRTELSVELTSPPAAGAGRGLVLNALGLLPAGAPVFAAVAPGNARSLRAFLALGFVPIGSEIIVQRAHGDILP